MPQIFHTIPLAIMLRNHGKTCRTAVHGIGLVDDGKGHSENYELRVTNLELAPLIPPKGGKTGGILFERRHIWRLNKKMKYKLGSWNLTVRFILFVFILFV